MNKKLIIIIIAAVVVIGAAVAALFLTGIIGGGDPAEEEPREVHYYPMSDYLVVNVADGGGVLFKTNLVLVADTEDVAEFAAENDYIIRDTLIFLFRSLTIAELYRQDIQDELRERIPAMLNELLGTEMFYSVVFTDFVLQ